MAMNGNESEAALLIEAERMQIIIRGDQPEPLAACLSRHLRHGLDQLHPYPDPRLKAIECDNLARLILKCIGEQAHRFFLQDGDETRQPLWLVDRTMSHHERIAPLFDGGLLNPCAIVRG